MGRASADTGGAAGAGACGWGRTMYFSRTDFSSGPRTFRLTPEVSAQPVMVTYLTVASAVYTSSPEFWLLM